jgi:hypothetical protein
MRYYCCNTGSFVQVVRTPRIWCFFLVLRLWHDADFSRALESGEPLFTTWNPFSLAELLQTPSELAGASATDEYMQCLRDAPALGGRSQCARHRPRLGALEQQGVEVMQVKAPSIDMHLRDFLPGNQKESSMKMDVY